jgi:uncharacterized protein (TIGR02677 family)
MNKYHLDPVKAFKYVTEPNAPIYRAIMRFLHEQHIRLKHYTMTAEHIYQMLKENEIIDETKHTYSHLQEWLNSLETWEAIQSRQNEQQGNTIPEWKKRRYLYQITDLGVEIEELLTRIDYLDEKLMSNLESRKFSLLLKNLEQLRDQNPKYIESNEKVHEIWSNVFDIHKELRSNSSNYLYHIHEAERKDLFNSMLFLEFKDMFIQYLGKYITELNRLKYRLAKTIQSISDEHVELYIQILVETNRPKSLFNENFSPEKLETTLRNRWKEVQAWFLGIDGSTSDIEVLTMKTREAIRIIVAYANRLTDSIESSQSRIDDYRSLANMFLQSDSLKSAHTLFSTSFGASHSLSLQVNEEMDVVESGEFSTPDEIWHTNKTPYQVPNMSNRGPKGITVATKIKNNKKEQQRRTIEQLESRREEEQKLKELIQGGKIILADVKELEPFLRKIILKWLMRTTKLRTSKNKILKPFETETGLTFRVRYRSKDRIRVKCEDGVLIGPDIELIFESGET